MDKKTSVTIKGYFVVLGDERKSLNEKFKKKAPLDLDIGRAGIFYKKEDLVSTIQSKAVLKNIPMDVVEIAVPLCCIIDPNGKKFDIKSGTDITIINIQSFQQVMKEIMMNEIA